MEALNGVLATAGLLLGGLGAGRLLWQFMHDPEVEKMGATGWVPFLGSIAFVLWTLAEFRRTWPCLALIAVAVVAFFLAMTL